MTTLAMLNVVGYAAMLAVGLLVGSRFGGGIVADLSGAMGSFEARLKAIEMALHLGGAIAKGTPDSATAALKSNGEAVGKSAAAMETQTMPKSTGK